MNFIETLWFQFLSTLPLFCLILLGYLLIKLMKWPKYVTDGLNKFTFSIAIPVMLFEIMSHFSELPTADYRVLFAFFGATFIVFILARVFAQKGFKLNGAQGTIFAIGTIYSNNVFVGLPLIKVLIGNEAIPIVALIVSFTALTLWSLATISIEFAVAGKLSTTGIKKVAKNVIKNPVIIGIISGLLVNYSRVPMPPFISQSTSMISDMAAPLSLIVLGMGLAEYRMRDGWRISGAISVMKLIIQPFIIYCLARLIGLPELETNVVVLLGSMATAINCYMMARQFQLLQAEIASSLLMTTLFSAMTTPLILTILTHL